jgi:hypothetical protein
MTTAGWNSTCFSKLFVGIRCFVYYIVGVRTCALLARELRTCALLARELRTCALLARELRTCALLARERKRGKLETLKAGQLIGSWFHVGLSHIHEGFSKAQSHKIHNRFDVYLCVSVFGTSALHFPHNSQHLPPTFYNTIQIRGSIRSWR